MSSKKVGTYSGTVDLSGAGTITIGDITFVENAVVETSNTSNVAKVTNTSGNDVTVDAYAISDGTEDTSTTDLAVTVFYEGY